MVFFVKGLKKMKKGPQLWGNELRSKDLLRQRSLNFGLARADMS